MQDGRLGKQFFSGEVICRQGETGEVMFVIQAGIAEVTRKSAGGGEFKLGELSEGAVFGEMSIFTKSPRSATVTAKGDARILTLDKRGFLKRVHEDPSLAFNILETLSRRVQQLDEKVESLQIAITETISNVGDE
ncbi:MAG: cyclic nucleotide-binding domain-containing protein [Chloroflexi bacterium]|nr:cyclic nucleotide-binding domain-containing protein [Chloroflexota bacterium]